MATIKTATKTKSKTKPGRRTIASIGDELDHLRDQVAALTEEVAALRGQNSGVAPATTLPVVRAAATATTASTAAAPLAPATPAANADPIAAVHTLLRTVFAIAQEPLAEDEEERDAQFDRFKLLVHSDRKGTGVLDQSLRNYTWAQLRKKVDIYLDSTADVGSYSVTRMAPDAVGRQTSRVKLFLKAKTRMPTPITLRRDERDGNQWRVESSSL